jgi:3,4-dihydroxy-2-butanone 4-phosphate synthase
MTPIPLHPHPMKLNTIDELLADMRAGKMVVLMDDEDRENEGDLIMAASTCAPKTSTSWRTTGAV